MSGYKITNTDGIILSADNKGAVIPSTTSISNASTNVPEGSIIYAIDTKQIYRFNGTNWLIAAGTSGTAGANGNSGSSGTSGSSGSSGTGGSSGTSGSSGSSGSTGTSGSSGSSGASGSSGSSGSTGTSGSSGSTGSSGSSGSSGSTGTSGSSGSSGSTGSSGSSGSAGSSGAAIPGGFSILYSGTNLSSTTYVSGQISYSSASLTTNSGDLRISGTDGNSVVIQNGSTATVLDRLITVAGTGSAGHTLRIFERGNSAKVNFYSYTTFAKRTTPTNTDAIFSSLTYLGGSGESTFTNPTIALEIAGAAGSSGSSGSSGQSGAAGSSGSSGSSGSTGSSGSSGQTGGAGSSGSSGSSGQSGAAGSSGSSGQTGGAGSSGSSGSSGQTGGAGSSGSSGSSGQTGGAGSSGTSGTSPSAAAYVAKAGDTMTGNLTINSSGAYPLRISSTQRYQLQVLNSNNTVNSGYGWWWFTDTNFNMGFHADGAADRFTLTRDGNLTITGTIGASNFSGTSSGTNTGDQSSVSGNAGSVTHNASRTDSTSYNVGWFTGASSPAYSCNAVQIQSSTGTLAATNLTGTLKQRYSSTGTRIYNPPGGIITTVASTQTGAITITMPKMPDVMISFWIDVYDYNPNTTFSIFVSGYPYSSAGVWSNTSAMILGAVSRQFTVRFGGSNDNTKSIIYVGETGSVWSYPQVQVRDVLIGYNALTGNVDGLDWAISWSTSLLNVTVTRTDVLPFASNANTLGGNSPNQTGGANTIVQRDANGYIQNSYFYASGGGSERNASGMGYFAGHNSSDYYYRSYTAGAAATLLGLGTMAYAATSSYVAKSGDTMTSTLTMSIGSGSGNSGTNGIYISQAVLDNTHQYALYMYENGGQATGYQDIAWYNGNQSYFKARMYTQVGGGYANTRFILDVADNARTLATRLYFDNGSAYFSGDVVAYSSDKRLKENVIPIGDSLNKIKQISGVYFDWKDKVEGTDFVPAQKHDVGVIAQDVQKILPEVVTLAPFDTDSYGKSKSGENYLTVKYDKLVPLLIEAVKEQQTQIESQKSQNEELIKRIETLESILQNKGI